VYQYDAEEGSLSKHKFYTQSKWTSKANPQSYFATVVLPDTHTILDNMDFPMASTANSLGDFTMCFKLDFYMAILQDKTHTPKIKMSNLPTEIVYQNIDPLFAIEEIVKCEQGSWAFYG
jgi:hypothetical protein